jgi:hypothetical protein
VFTRLPQSAAFALVIREAESGAAQPLTQNWTAGLKK